MLRKLCSLKSVKKSVVRIQAKEKEKKEKQQKAWVWLENVPTSFHVLSRNSFLTF
jgi:hypothetical protein